MSSPPRDPSSPDTAAVSHPDRHALERLVADANRAQDDVDGLGALHLPDTIVVNAPGRRVVGRDALLDAMRAALATSLRDVVTSVEVVDIRSVAEDVAVISCLKTIEDRRTEGAGDPLRFSHGALTYVASHTDAGWRIALAQTTPILSPTTAS